MHDYPTRRREVGRQMRSYGTAASETMAAFQELHRASLTNGALPTATKELIALAIGICQRCEGCIAFHVHDALAAGATHEEVAEAIGVAVMMGGGPAAVYASEAWLALEQYEQPVVES